MPDRYPAQNIDPSYIRTVRLFCRHLIVRDCSLRKNSVARSRTIVAHVRLFLVREHLYRLNVFDRWDNQIAVQRYSGLDMM